jgi:hypothetical protein
MLAPAAGISTLNEGVAMPLPGFVGRGQHAASAPVQEGVDLGDDG